MSGLINAIRLRLGLSNTPANNFVLRALDDGLLRISRGNPLAETTDVLTVGADNVLSAAVSPPAGDDSNRLATTAFVADVALGVGQSWQNVTPSRVLGTTYTNTTGRPIMVVVTASSSTTTNAVAAAATVNGVNISTRVTNESAGASYQGMGGPQEFIVPAGATYSVSVPTGAVLQLWCELR